MKKTIRMNERELHNLISESVKRVLNEQDTELGDRVEKLKKTSRTYKANDTSKTNLDKTWNRGMGRQSFIEILPDEGVILYNTMLTRRRDLERIQQVFPEFKLEPVDKPYYSNSSLRRHRNTL